MRYIREPFGKPFLKWIYTFDNHQFCITFIGFGGQEGWITTDIKTYTQIVKTNSKTMFRNQLLDESQSAIEFNDASPVQSNQSNRLNVVIYLV